MELRQKYCACERERLEQETKNKIARIMIVPGIDSPRYEETYEAIMQEYRLRVENLRVLLSL